MERVCYVSMDGDRLLAAFLGRLAFWSGALMHSMALGDWRKISTHWTAF